MFNHRLDQKPDSSVLFNWFLLSFNAGCINAGGFLATGSFVSHVTGFATLFGVHLMNRDHEAALGLLAVPLFFLLGAFLAGLLIDRQIYRNKRPHFDYVMGLSCICLVGASLGGALSQFGGFGNGMHLKQNFILLALLCLACGLQNAAITSSSGSSIRTTHLTGLTTDLGLGLARLVSFHRNDRSFSHERDANNLRIGSICSFVLGSAVGAWFFIKLHYFGFLFSGIIAAYAAWHGRLAKITSHRLTTP